MDTAGFETNGDSLELIVVLHGLNLSREAMTGVLTAIRSEKKDADIYCPTLAYGGRIIGAFSREPIEKIVHEQMRAIARHWRERRARGDKSPYAAITLIGHSMGGVIARKIAILAYGETPGTPFEREFEAYRAPSAFAPAIKRIVMLAGLSRGWSVASAKSWTQAFTWGVMEVFGELSAWTTGVPFTVFSVRRGAPFLVQTRLQWLALVMRPIRVHGKWNPMTSDPARFDAVCQNYSPDFDLIQLLGTQDDTVSPEDMLDNSVEMENNNYFVLEVPHSTHLKIIDMEPLPRDEGATGEERALDWEDPKHQRYFQFKVALTKTREELKRIAIAWEDVSDVMPDEPEWDVSDVVFVIHGIRDKGFWTQKIARRIKQFARTDPGKPKRLNRLPYRSVTASYGYFAMAPFVLQPVRTRKVAWLMDQYTEAKVRYPNAKFSYVGHSNGTYLVARALKDYPAAKFNRIVFAGSVVRSDCDWSDLATPDPKELCQAPRIEKVLNYVATSDWVVAAFPKAMQWLKSIDLGGAGHDGFYQAYPLRQAETLEAAREALRSKQVLQLQYVEGTHDAAIRELHWGDIASFVVTGEIPWLNNATTKQQRKVQESFLDNSGGFATKQPWWSRMLGKSSRVLFPIVVALVLALGGWLAWRMIDVPPCAELATCAAETTKVVLARVLAFIAYLLLLRVFVTKY
jgi:pimeloyl-ACP methyl ester carboxylesterase